MAAATGGRNDPSVALKLAALRGREAEASAAIAGAIEQAAAGGQGLAASYAHWAAAVLHNGLARYEEAASAARHATSDTVFPWPSMWAWPELVEAAARGEEMPSSQAMRSSGSRRRRGRRHRLGAWHRGPLPGAAERRCSRRALYREAIDRLGRAQLRPDLARAHLLFGERLRREGRRVDAREQLRTAHDMLAAIGMEAFAERARRELSQRGRRCASAPPRRATQLTPQEEQIARLARDGLSNPEIGAQLFLSARTVEWHLRKVFTKLGIGSRYELKAALAQRGHDGQPAWPGPQ